MKLAMIDNKNKMIDIKNAALLITIDKNHTKRS
jgi:hypothetical protein